VDERGRDRAVRFNGPVTADPGSRTRLHSRPPRRRDRSFGSALALTVLGALLPGAAFIAAGRRLLGFALLTLAGVAVMLGVGVLIVEHDPSMLGAELASRPNLLLAVTAGLVVAAIVWVVVIITGHLAVRSAGAPRWQRGVGIGVAVSLSLVVAYPAFYGARASMATYGLVTEVFQQAPVDADGDGDVDQVEPDREDPWAGRPRLNVLLLGADAADGREGLRTDSVILASINTHDGDTVLLSLPRNLQDVPFRSGSPLVEVWPDGFDCGDRCLLNAVYEQGEVYAEDFPAGTKDPGVAAVSDAVSATLGLDVDFFLMVDLGGFEALIDALGGIDINIGPERVPMGGTDIFGNDQPEWAIEEWIAAGPQHLDGEEALWFSRSRWRSTDYERMERQRCVLNAVVEQASPTNLLSNYLDLAAAAEEIITTDVPYQLFPAFLDLAGKVQSTPVRSLAFTDEVILDRANPDFDEIRNLVRASLDPPPPAAVAPPATSAPGTTTAPGGPPPTVTPTIDPTIAAAADEVCG